VFNQNRDARIELCTSLAARIEIWNWTVLREKVTAITAAVIIVICITVTVVHVTTQQHCVHTCTMGIVSVRSISWSVIVKVTDCVRLNSH
jgi:hypothetical protein